MKNIHGLSTEGFTKKGKVEVMFCYVCRRETEHLVFEAPEGTKKVCPYCKRTNIS